MNNPAAISTTSSLEAIETPRIVDNNNLTPRDELGQSKIVARSILRKGSKYQMGLQLISPRQERPDAKFNGKSHKISFKQGVEVKEVECMYEIEDIYAREDRRDCCNMF